MLITSCMDYIPKNALCQGKIGRSIRERKARLHQAKRDLWYFLLDREIFLWYNSKDSPR